MTERKDILISTSKKKLLLLSLTCAVFILVGVWIILYNPSVRNPFFDNFYFKYLVGGLSVLVFGIFIIYPIIKLFDTKPALIIDENGIVDNSSAVALGRIPWNDIISITETKYFTQKFITVKLSNPEYYIERQSNKLKRKTLKANFNKNGSPVNISTNSMSIKHDQLLQLLKDRLEAFKTTSVNL